MNYLEDLLRFIGIFLLMLGVEHIVSTFQPEETGGSKASTMDQKPITPLTPPPPPSPRAPADEKDPRLEAIRRWQRQKLMDDREMWQIRAARARSRNPADDVNPPRIPTKRTR